MSRPPLPEHADLVGAKMLKIGDVPVEEALRTGRGHHLARQRDERALGRAARCSRRCRCLRGLGIVSGDGPVPLEIEDAAGKTRHVELRR